MLEERAYWLSWLQIPGIGPTLLRRLYYHFGSLETAWDARLDELLYVDGVGEQIAATIATYRPTLQPAALLQSHLETNPQFWVPADAAYPQLLLEIPDPPPILYYEGQVDLQENLGSALMVAIVGTRSPSDYGRRWTRRLTEALVQQGFTIVSGLAEGIDREAHQACLQAGGRTIAVLGNGVDVVYPWSNRALYDQIREAGLLLSEYPTGTPPDRPHFPCRNRIVAGLCRAVIVVEAPAKSGALITAHLANDYNRDVYALPGSLDNPRSLGCLGLINQGAQMILGETQLLDALGAIPGLSTTATPAPQQTSLPLQLPPEQAQILQAIADIAQHTAVTSASLDQIIAHTGLPASEVSTALLQLELLELVTNQPGMRYQRC
jgi:DNA processing protein